MSLASYLRSFFGRVEAVPPEQAKPEELVDGKAFTIRHYPLRQTINAAPNDTITATVHEDGELLAEVSEPIGVSMTIDTISMIRFNDALGYKHAVGAIFGKRNKP